MAELKQKLADSQAVTITLNSLANGAGRGSNSIDNSSTLAPRADIRIKIKTGGSGVSTSGYLDVYLIKSENGTNYDDGFGGTDGSFTPVNACKIGIIRAVANGTSYEEVFSTDQSGTLPRKFCIGVVNNTGATLDGTAGNFSVSITLKTDQLS
jgi:hypothetical protein